MSEPVLAADVPGFPDLPVDAPRTNASDSTVADVRRAALVAGVLVVLGALLGLLWGRLSPPGPRALVVSPGVFIPDETESFVAGDARYLFITAATGLLAALVAWRMTQHRGPVLPLGVGSGALVGALATELVGHLSGGGSFDGAPNTVIDRLPLSLHMSGLVFVEPALALLLYGMIAAFAVHDDLGRPDPIHDSLRPAPVAQDPGPLGHPFPGSVDAGHHPQHGWGHGDAPGALQQRDLPPQ